MLMINLENIFEYKLENISNKIKDMKSNVFLLKELF